jgi:hypothetical protein
MTSTPRILPSSRPSATHMVRRMDYMPAFVRPGPYWMYVARSRGKPRYTDHWIFTNTTTGESRYGVFVKETPTSWLLYCSRSRSRPEAISRLSRAHWRPAWLVCGIHLSEATNAFYDARAIGEAALAESILDAGREQKPLPPLPAGATVPDLVKLERPGLY